MPLYHHDGETVEAVQWTGANIEDIGAMDGRTTAIVAGLNLDVHGDEIVTAVPGDFIVKGVDRRLAAVKRDDFVRDYEAVNGA